MELLRTVTSQQQPVFNIPEVQFYYISDLSIVVTSLQQPLIWCPMGGCCREVALYLDYLSTLHPSLQILCANITEIVSSDFSVYQRDGTTYFYKDI